MPAVATIDPLTDIFGDQSQVDVRTLTDAELLGRFVEGRDAGVFESILQRHAPMVLGICRRLIRDRQDAEDACQATFLVLSLKAKDIQPRSQLGSWLYGVAVRTALKARTKARRRREFATADAGDIMDRNPEACEQAEINEFAELLDRELAGLPETYRTPIVLCDLERKTLKEAARQLGWPEGTVSGRLARGRKLLSDRLARRGLLFAGGSVIAALADRAVLAQVPDSLIRQTGDAVGQLAKNAAWLEDPASGAAARLVKEGLKAPRRAIFRALFAVGLVVVGLAVAVGLANWLGDRNRVAVFAGIGDLLDGTGESHAMCVSDDGNIIAGHARNAKGGLDPFLHSKSAGMTSLREGPEANAFGVVWRIDGRVAVGQISSGAEARAARWDSAGRRLLEGLSGGAGSGIAFGVSRDGEVVVGVSHGPNGPEAFRWTAAEKTIGLGDWLGGAFNSLASDVSADGSVICGNGATETGTMAFRWTNDDLMRALGDLEGGEIHSEAAAISADGLAIVGSSKTESGHRAYRWTERAGMVRLGAMAGALETFSTAVTEHGGVIVGAARTTAGESAFLWTEKLGTMRLQEFLERECRLDLSGWRLTHARDISADGRTIVGYGINPRGQIEGWVVRLKEAPGPP